MTDHSLQRSSLQEVAMDAGDLEDIDEETHSCALLSSRPEQMNVAARKQLCGNREAITIVANGDTDDTLAETLPNLEKLPRGSSVFNFRNILLFALLFRLILLAFSTWHDQTRWPDGQLRFTDVDYDVFTDAAKALVAGNDIYEARPTYRYSPLIAALLAPGHMMFGSKPNTASSSDAFFDPPVQTKSTLRTSNLSGNSDHFLARIWGKLIFVLSDLICAYLQYRIMEVECMLHNADRYAVPGEGNTQVHPYATWFIAFGWLFNPITAVVSVRGNAEAFLGLCVLSCLLLVLTNRVFFAGLLFGLCIHLKIYPVIYAPAIYLWLSRRHISRSTGQWISRLYAILPTREHLLFGFATLFSFGLLTTGSYVWFGGMRFLWQAYLYHIGRIDIKHNFSPHFYPLYLLTASKWKLDEMTLSSSQNASTLLSKGLLERLQTSLARFTVTQRSDTLLERVVSVVMNNVHGLLQVFNFVSFLPALLLIPRLSFKLFRHPGLCWFVVTYTFVTFNKVCTSQYFLWSLVLLPIALGSLRLPPSVSARRAVLENLLLWFGAQAFWLASAYTLEMRTHSSEFVAQSVWRLVWVASMVFLLVNVILIRRFIKWQRPCCCSTVAEGIPSEGKKTQ